jgi:F-type H+-transporting ATPase subunit epsilon
MHCTIRSADRTYYEDEADLIVARSPHGEFAVMDGHADLLAVLTSGVLRWKRAGVEHAIVCQGGTLSLTGNRATLLVERPYRMDEIDLAAVRAQLETLRTEPPSGPHVAHDIAYLELVCRAKETHG